MGIIYLSQVCVVGCMGVAWWEGGEEVGTMSHSEQHLCWEGPGPYGYFKLIHLELLGSPDEETSPQD